MNLSWLIVLSRAVYERIPLTKNPEMLEALHNDLTAAQAVVVEKDEDVAAKVEALRRRGHWAVSMFE